MSEFVEPFNLDPILYESYYYIGSIKHKLSYNIDDTIFQQVAYDGGIAVLERRLNKPSQTKKFTRSNGQSLLNFVDECPR